MNNYIIYKHTSPNGKIYIGLTNKSLEKRWKLGYKHNKYFTDAINKYGSENFKHEIIYSGLTHIEAEKKEIETIALFRSNEREYGYNLTSGGGGRLGYKHTEASKRKMSKSATGKKKSDEHRKNISIANKKRFQDPKQRELLASLQKGRKHTREHIDKCIAKRLKEVYQLDLDGNIIKSFSSLQEASIETNISDTYICNVCRGRNNSAKGYKWRYADEI